MNNILNSKKKFNLFIINSGLLATKYYEQAIHQPNPSRFESIELNYEIDECDNIKNEIECLKILLYIYIN